MTDTSEIKNVIKKKGFTLDSLSKEISMSRTTLSYKINNKVEFNAKEIKEIQNVLGLTDDERDFIFFRLG